MKPISITSTGMNHLRRISVFVVLFLLPLPAGAQEHTAVMVSYAAVNANMLNLWVAKEAGYFRGEGIDAGLILVRGGSLGVQLLLSGQTPITLVGATAIANAYLQGNKDLVMIGGVTNIMSYLLAAKPEIQKPEEIKGKTLAVSRFGSTADFVAEYALRHLGLKKTDVSMIQIGTENDRLAAMQHGDISLSVFSPTYATAIKQAGMNVLLDLERMKIPYLLAGYATTRTLLARDRLLAVKFTRGIIKSIRRIKTDRPYAQRILSKYLNTGDANLLNVALDQQVRILPDLPYPTEEGIKTILDDVGRTIPTARQLAPAALMDPTIVRDAAKN